MKTPSWDDYFMAMVYLVASRSKDENTHVGAVIIGPGREIRSTGYNSFPRGINDNVPERQERPEKYFWFEHAERNALYNASRNGVSLEECVMYTKRVPCADCAMGVIQTGIKEVIVDKKWGEQAPEKWKDHVKRTLEMFGEVGVRVREWEGDLVDIARFRRGEIIK